MKTKAPSLPCNLDGECDYAVCEAQIFHMQKSLSARRNDNQMHPQTTYDWKAYHALTDTIDHTFRKQPL